MDTPDTAQFQDVRDALGVQDIEVHSLLETASRLYPSISAMLRTMAECPECFRFLARTPQAEDSFREKIARWKASGCPELEWPEIKNVF